MGFSVKVGTTGKWEQAAGALNWLQSGLDRALKHALQQEAKYITDLLKKNLRGGGSPGFAPLSPFTAVIRRAMGVPGRRPGVATGQVLRAITATKLDKHTYFCGVLRGNDAHISKSGRVNDVADMALLLEVGRPKFFMELDKAGTSGKTPRQWLWWLYLSGATTTPPGFSATHIAIGQAPARPFVSQVASKEQAKIPQRITDNLHKRFLQTVGSM